MERQAAKAKPAKVTVAKELSDIIYFKTTHFKSFAKPGPSWEMSSFSESKVKSLLKKEAPAFAVYNKTQMSRIYPMGIRVDSSNYDPVPSW